VDISEEEEAARQHTRGLLWLNCVHRIKHDPKFADRWAGGADEAWASDLHLGASKPEPRLKSAQVAPKSTTAEPALAGCMQIALRRASAWTSWHSDRAEARGLTNACDGLARAASAFAGMRSVVECRGAVRVSVGWLAERVFDSVRCQAERDARKGGRHDAADDQYRDVAADTGLREAIYAIGNIASFAVSMRAGIIDSTEAANAAVDVILNLPEVPAQSDISGNE
jgi:hypothetical protein